MRTAQTPPAARQPRRDSQPSRWPLAVTGLVLLVVSVVMMATGAQPSRAQIAHPQLAPSRLAQLRLPAPTGRYQVGTAAAHFGATTGKPFYDVPPG
jgi:hypothetical protein